MSDLFLFEPDKKIRKIWKVRVLAESRYANAYNNVFQASQVFTTKYNGETGVDIQDLVR